MGRTALDLTRPFMCRQDEHLKNPPVYMFKDDPGVFFLPNGTEVGADKAAQVGYDVVELDIARKKAARKAEAMAQIEKEFAKSVEAIEGEIDPPEEKKPSKLKALPSALGKDGVRRTSIGEPRETKYREIVYETGIGWKCIEKATGVETPCRDKDQAEKMLLAGGAEVQGGE